ncbi:alternative ribosome rescue aminoacyl-tRNA hydrolase ArfB [Stappia sp.]|uniref:alternative ribosome rescue aminoacyl-tRNA hydrolase ArfB n=1 Tax=Stappia sp. TaxID=1870903 RepID=UPI0032D8E9F6
MSQDTWQDALVVGRGITIPARELSEEFIRASGPGGQNVNKVSSAVQLRFHLAANETLPEDVKARLARLAGQRLTRDGDILIQADRFRSQERNREDARERLVALVERALERPKPRRPTRPTRGSKERRLASKKQRGQTKKLRGRPVD